MMMMYGMMVQFVGLSTVKQKVWKYKISFSDGETTLIILDAKKPWTDLLFTTCEVLYDDDVWYDGTVCGFEYCETESVWKYKISFSDGGRL